MIIPWQDIAPDTLDNLIKEYILGELEEHQTEHIDLPKWQEQVKQRLMNSEAVIEWSEANETAAIVDAKKYAKGQSNL